MKKKKKADVSLVKTKVDRKIRKLEKEVRKLRKTPNQLKPIEEYVLPPAVMREIPRRTRKLGKETKEFFATYEKLNRIWIEYKLQESASELQALVRIQKAQDKALNELKSESLELYLAALQIDDDLLPFADKVIIKETPANKEYNPPDGRQTDVSKVWSM